MAYSRSILIPSVRFPTIPGFNRYTGPSIPIPYSRYQQTIRPQPALRSWIRPKPWPPPPPSRKPQLFG